MGRKRFTDADKWEDGWFCDQSGPIKLFWIYLCDRCDHAGVWEVNWRLAEFHLGGVDRAQIEKALEGKFQVIKGGKAWFIPGFIKFQYPTGLSENSPAHRRIRSTMSAHGLNPNTLSPTLPPTLPPRVFNTPEDKDVDRDEEEDSRESAERGGTKARQQAAFRSLLIRLLVADGSVAIRKWWALACGNPRAKTFEQRCDLVEWCVVTARKRQIDVQYASHVLALVDEWRPTIAKERQERATA